MSHQPFVIKSERILSPSGIIKGEVLVNNGKIDQVSRKVDSSTTSVMDVGMSVVMPGLIDPHVHINEPGRTNWEGFLTATQSAAAGGTTSLVDMPLNSTPVTVSKTAFHEKLAASKNKLYVNTGFWGGLTPNSLTHLPELLKSGIFGIKVFLCDSGIEDFPKITKRELKAALPMLKEIGLPLLVHAEIVAPQPKVDTTKKYQVYLESRPPEWELAAIQLLIGLAEEFETSIHIVHLSSSQALPVLIEARKRLPITVETCPHYLYFASEEISDGHTEYKCAPPIRNSKNNQGLWSALEDGVIDFITTDHSPAPMDLKLTDTGDFMNAWGGISSIQFTLPIIWSLGKDRGLSLQNLSELVSSRAAKFLGLDLNKGKIAPGFDADIVIWNPEETFVVTADIIKFKHKMTPYLNHSLTGKVQKTIVGGHLVFDNGFIIGEPKGSILTK